MNRVNLTGRITRDPEVRNGASSSFVGFSLAVDRGYKDANGQRSADFINCIAFRSQADFIGRYVKKGNMLAIEGRLQTRSYQDQNGQNRQVMEVVVDNVENLTPRQQNDQGYQGNNMNNYGNNYNNNGYSNSYNNYQQPQYQQPSYQQPAYNQSISQDTNDYDQSFDIEDSDLPF